LTISPIKIVAGDDMKKVILVLLMVLTMASSLVAGTLAKYTTSIDKLADGSVVAKEFIFTGAGTDTFQQGVKIAPSETVNWKFKVKNYSNSIVTETDMYYKLTLNVAASAGKSAILPLKVIVRDSSGNVLNSVTGIGSFDVYGSFPLSEYGQEKEYSVDITWPKDGTSDIKYAGSQFGTSINVQATASQIPFDGNTNENKNIQVKYETTVPWQNGQSGNYEFEYKVTITNNSTTPINDWNIGFKLDNDKLVRAWSNASLVSGLPAGTYKFVDPNYNNTSTDNILPGQSVSFRGPAQGMGNEPIKNITIGGSNLSSSTNASLTCEFGKSSLN
jgi:hypothetical protein